LKRWAEVWSSFPAAHKKRCYQGLGGYVLLVLLTGAWISFRAHDTIKDWQSHIPSATAEVKNVYLTPQIAAAAPDEEPKETPVAAAPSYDDGKIYVSVIVSGLGLSTPATQRAVDDLPAQMTLAFSPYADNVKGWIKKALAEKHETLLLLPMEAIAYPQNDPGPRALSSRHSDQNNNENLNWMLAQGEGSTGVMNYMGTRFMTDQKRLINTFNTLRKNSALFIETPGIDKSAAAAAASKTGLPYMEARIEIDAIATDSAIRAQLDALEQTARKHGYAIGIAQPYPLTMNILKSWADGLSARGIVLAPLRTVWKNKPHYEDTSAPSQEQLRQP
jgi:polysaccharide deacetylase 2 family uncharacterized protein YibQ